MILQHRCAVNQVYQTKKKAILSTCIVYLENSYGLKIPVRANLNNGSEATFLAKHIADLLSIRKDKTNVDILRIYGKIKKIKLKVQIFISNKGDSFKKPLSF